MFYPNSVLISRTPGIATIWLMATLGAKQNSKKISKQAILQIDIPEACQAVQYPDAPMALRLQSNLLYGISRVYSQKCLFVLAEAEATQNTLNNLFRLVRKSELDPRAGKIRPELLVVPDDASFMLNINLPTIDFDASAIFDSSGPSFLESGVTGPSGASSQSNRSLYNFDIPQLDIPSSESFGDPNLPLDTGRSSVNNLFSTELEEAGFLYDAGFEFDAAGNIIDHDVPGVIPPGSSQTDQVADIEQDSTKPTTGALPISSTQSVGQLKDGVPSFFDDTGLLQDPTGQGALGESVRSVDASEYIETPQARRKRAATKLLPRDTEIVLPTSQVRQQEQNYVLYMNEVRKTREAKRRARHSRGNAALILGNIGRIDGEMGGRVIANSLHKLSVDLLEQLTRSATDENIPKKDLKRRANSVDFSSSDPENPRSRIRIHDDKEDFRGDLVENEEGYTVILDETVPSIELAREAMTIAEDQSTQLPLPWSGSRAGSVHSGRLSRQASVLSARVAGNTSVSRVGSLRLFDRRASRLPSASPLVGNTSAHNTPGGVSHGLQLNSQNDNFIFDVGGNLDTSPQGPGLEVQGFGSFSPLAAGHSSGITKENADFLAWIQDAVAAKAQQIEEGNELSTNITFDELLPVQEHPRAVAAQGFLQLLTLANSGTIETSQQTKNNDNGDDLWWGPLYISVVEGY